MILVKGLTDRCVTSQIVSRFMDDGFDAITSHGKLEWGVCVAESDVTRVTVL